MIRLKGFAGAASRALSPAPRSGIAELGKCFKALKRAGCEAVCLAGNVSRPDFSTPDARPARPALLPGLIAAARKGDDALLRLLVGEFEKEGFAVEGAHEVMDDLTLPARARWAASRRPTSSWPTSRRPWRWRAPSAASTSARPRSSCDGLVLAVEAQEGTDAMLARVADCRPTCAAARAGAGVLAKAPKPIQETRVDLPTIGLATVQARPRAGLAGIVGEAGRLLVLDRDSGDRGRRPSWACSSGRRAAGREPRRSPSCWWRPRPPATSWARAWRGR